MRKIAAALIAATMFTIPVFAQGTAPAVSTPMTQPAKAAVAKPNVVTVKKHHVKKHHVKKHTAKQAKHIRNVRHAKPSKSKPTGARVTHAPTNPAASLRIN